MNQPCPSVTGAHPDLVTDKLITVTIGKRFSNSLSFCPETAASSAGTKTAKGANDVPIPEIRNRLNNPQVILDWNCLMETTAGHQRSCSRLLNTLKTTEDIERHPDYQIQTGR